MLQMFNSIFILRLTKQCIHITLIKQTSAFLSFNITNAIKDIQQQDCYILSEEIQISES